MSKEKMTFFVEENGKNSIVLEFWKPLKGWIRYEATRISPGIARTAKGRLVEFNENKLTESLRASIETGTAKTEKKTKAKAAHVPGASSEYDFAVGIMNKFGLEPEQTKELIDLCKARYSTGKSAESTKEEKLKSLFN